MTSVDVAVIPNLDIVGAEGLPVAVLTVDEGGGFHRVVDLVYVASGQAARPVRGLGSTGACLPHQPS